MPTTLPSEPLKGKVANFKEEGLVTLKGGEGEKCILKINLSMQGIEHRSPDIPE